MAVVKPFKGIRYNAETHEDFSLLITPPYDVINEEYQNDLYERDPHNIVRIDYGKTFETDTDADNRYTRASKIFADWRSEGVMVQDEDPQLYYVEEDYKGEFDAPCTRRGFLGAVKVETAESGVYRPHEKTLAGPKADRLKLTVATKANLSPVFSLYDDPDGQIDKAFAKWKENAGAPDEDVVSDEGTRVRMWKVSDPAVLDTVSTVMGPKSFFIADGHHRYETALNYRSMMAENNPVETTGDEPWNYVLMYLVNLWSEGLSVLPTHRAVFGLENFSSANFKEKLSQYFEIESVEGDSSKLMEKLREVRGSSNSFGVAIGGESTLFKITLKESVDLDVLLSGRAPALRTLDVSILHGIVIEEILGIDEKAQEQQLNLRYVKKDKELEEQVAKGEADLGFFMNPTPVEQVKEAAESGERMPQKSTYFFPKIITGLVINPLSEGDV